MDALLMYYDDGVMIEIVIRGIPGTPNSKPHISDWVENAYKGPYVYFCDLQLF